jgi:5,10-methylenetetrahydrofolate reductase
MAKLNEKIAKFQEDHPGQPFFSFEFFPPKTEVGNVNIVNVKVM